MNFIDFFFLKFFNNNKLIIIIYLIITSLYLLSEYILAPIIYSKIIISLNLNKKNNVFYNNFYFLIGIWLFIIFLGYIKEHIGIQIFPSYIKYYRSILLDLTLDKTNNNLNEIKIGNHLLRIIMNSSELSEENEVFLNKIIPSIFGILMITLYILFLNLKIGFFLFIGIFLCILIIFIFYKKIINLSIKQNIFFYNNIDKLNSKFSNISNIYINNKKEDEKKDSYNDQKEYQNLRVERLNSCNLLKILLYFTIISFYLLSILFGYKFYKKNILSKQNFILILIILSYLISLFFVIFNELTIFLNRIGIAENSYQYFKYLLNNKISNSNNLKINSGLIKIINLTYYYQTNKDKKYIFNNFNLEIKSGERIAIYGRSGFGKSTLAKLIMNLYNYEGKILLDNNDIKLIEDYILRKNIIYVNQKTDLLDDTILENIKYGNNINNEDIINIIEKYKLNNIFDNLNQNYNTNCGVNGSKLSLGMQKIIILLRAYFKFKESKVIIFDEPLASLDYLTKKKILKLINDIEKEKTIIIITHDEEIFSIVDRKINIENLIV